MMLVEGVCLPVSKSLLNIPSCKFKCNTTDLLNWSVLQWQQHTTLVVVRLKRNAVADKGHTYSKTQDISNIW